jgi:hypothetical protein
MNQTLSTIFVLLIGFIGGLLGSSFSGSTDAQYDMSIEGAAVNDTQELRDQISALQAANDSLRHQFDLQASGLAQLTERLSQAPPPPGSELSFGDMPTGQAFDAQVNAAIDQREADRDVERATARRERDEERTARRVERLAEELGLDSSQTAQFATILEDVATKRSDYFAEIRENGWENIDRDEMRSTMEEMREDEYSQIEGVLTPEQFTQYQESSSNERGGFGGGGGNRGGGNRGGGNGNDF